MMEQLFEVYNATSNPSLSEELLSGEVKNPENIEKLQKMLEIIEEMGKKDKR